MIIYSVIKVSQLKVIFYFLVIIVMFTTVDNKMFIATRPYDNTVSLNNCNCDSCENSIQCYGCYECNVCEYCYNSKWCENCNNCKECVFCDCCNNCVGCTDCLMCTGLKNKQFVVNNVQCRDKEEYYRAHSEFYK